MKIFSLIFTGPLTKNEVFQMVFRTPSILLSFLNEVLSNNILNVDKLVSVEILAKEQSVYSEGQYHIFHDVRARDAMGNTFVIEMERACELYDVVRFQYTSARVFAQLIDTRFKTLRKEAIDAAAKKTEEAKKKAEKVAVAKAEAENAKPENANKAEDEKAAKVEEAKAKAIKAVTEANPKAIGNQDLFKPKDVPTVIVIVIVEKGMPQRKFRSKFTTEDQYTLVSSYDEFEGESKMNFIYIDLTRFAGTKMLENPKTPLDHWCLFLWYAKNRQIKKEQLEKLQKFPVIQEAVEIIGKMQTIKMLELEAMQCERETLRGEGRGEGRLDVARKMLEKKLDDVMIMECADISAEQLEELKLSLL